MPIAFTPGKSIDAEPSNDPPPTFTLAARFVAVAALPDVSCVPACVTHGRLMSAVPSNDTPPMFTAACRAVAVAALPVMLVTDRSRNQSMSS